MVDFIDIFNKFSRKLSLQSSYYKNFKHGFRRFFRNFPFHRLCELSAAIQRDVNIKTGGNQFERSALFRIATFLSELAMTILFIPIPTGGTVGLP